MIRFDSIVLMINSDDGDAYPLYQGLKLLNDPKLKPLKLLLLPKGLKKSGPKNPPNWCWKMLD
jgi:hypothetical protein